jgi:hypothetical protein
MLLRASPPSIAAECIYRLVVSTVHAYCSLISISFPRVSSARVPGTMLATMHQQRPSPKNPTYPWRLEYRFPNSVMHALFSANIQTAPDPVDTMLDHGRLIWWWSQSRR